jgi:hypothetical protein
MKLNLSFRSSFFFFSYINSGSISQNVTDETGKQWNVKQFINKPKDSA